MNQKPVYEAQRENRAWERGWSEYIRKKLAPARRDPKWSAYPAWVTTKIGRTK